MLDYSKSRRLWFRIGLLVLILIIGLVVRNQVKVYRNRALRAAQAEAIVSNRQALFDLLQPVRLANCELERFGEAHDGGYLLCANLLGSVQAGYSYGISGYDKWGCDVSTRLKVPLHQYRLFQHRAAEMPHRGHEVPRGVRWSHDEDRRRPAVRHCPESVGEER